jgi:glyoxylase-like metal-dependent hydrolase (beta-lactamase superfamily II)
MKAFVNTFVFNQMKVNTHVLWNSKGDCVLIDPGCITEDEQKMLTDFVETKELKPLAILLTHGHFDHAAGVSFLRDKYRCECWIHPDDEKELSQVYELAQIYGMKVNHGFGSDHFFYEGTELSFGKIRMKVLHLPGHTRGSVALFESQNNYLFAGDTLMKGSLGFSNSGYKELMIHLKHKIYPLPDKTIVFCGHGASTTIEEEKKANLFFRMMKG